MDSKGLAKQRKEIDLVNREILKLGGSLTVLHSAEVNLSPSGTADMDNETLAKLDLVLGSFHSSLDQNKDQTARYLAALRDPSIHILGHPQCRRYNLRTGLTADWSRVFAEAAKLDKAVELDCFAERQDLKFSLLQIAKEEGARISLGTDSHHPWQMAFMDLGLAALCLVKMPPERVINFLPLDELKSWVAGLRESGYASND